MLEVGSVCEDQIEKQCSQSLGDCYFDDDISGKLLNTSLVKQAREDDNQGVLKRNLFTKLSLQKCYDKTGGPPVSF